ncbi:hypothetical protein H2200_012835 [Cladophialophora chaetospira]|uniref:Xylanolytic transcriptional activator regulatory domain-containing protein n=1 Tax=Cladophialophora chaetospira TaxID=386627 RepID=A0AA38WX09_9EURO|nr:hypothetical protein H2200_012835 [Cladophialophora chaetospira]
MSGIVNHNESIAKQAGDKISRLEQWEDPSSAILQNAEHTESPASSPESAAAQSWVFHHFHESQSYTISPCTLLPDKSAKESTATNAPTRNNTAYVCRILGISKQMLSTLVQSYFENVTFLSLFHPGTFDRKVFHSIDHGVASALLAAICAFAAHHTEPTGIQGMTKQDWTNSGATNTSSYFYGLARAIIQDQLEQCGDSRPSLALLQAFVLVTFYEMMTSARGRAWRSLGACVRIAHELELHLIDAILQGKTIKEQIALAHAESWSRNEEQRRTWWVIYELDIFASTVRRCPTSIQAGEYAVLLPVPDTAWFRGDYQASCFLDPDPLHRTRKLVESGNSSGKAWYLVVNSLMRDAHITSNPSACLECTLPRHNVACSPAMTRLEPVDERKLAVLDDFMLYFKTVLPKNLTYEGDYLSFSTSDVYGGSTITQDFDIQLIHAMVHLGKLMVVHHFACKTHISLCPKDQDLAEFLTASQLSATQKLRAILGFTDDLDAWDNYLGAAEEIMRVIRNTSPSHVRYGHPLLASTFWIVAATQLFRKVLARDEAEQELAQSNFDLLRLTLDSSRRFWNTSDMMVKNIDTLDARLVELKARLVGSQTSVHEITTRLNDDRAMTDLPPQAPLERAENNSSECRDDNTSAEWLTSELGLNPPDEHAVPQTTAASTGNLEGSELHAFMYDFCGENWDKWDEEFTDLFPPLLSQS